MRPDQIGEKRRAKVPFPARALERPNGCLAVTVVRKTIGEAAKERFESLDSGHRPDLRVLLSGTDFAFFPGHTGEWSRRMEPRIDAALVGLKGLRA